ncbi:MAG: protealysin inhibitor emfourin [Chloroflexota bacterium]
MLRIVFLSMLVSVLLIAGCASSPAVTEANTPAPTPVLLSTPTLPVADEWTIKLTHSGGIMGLMRSLEVSSDGKYTVVDERANKTVSGELSESELAELREVVASLDYKDKQKPNPGGCADCFMYDLEIQDGAKNFSIQVDDISLPESGMETLVRFLRELLDSALK